MMEADPKETTGSDASPPSPPEQPTETITRDVLKGRYQLGPELGRGGFAITYLATDLEVASRRVVVKVLNEWRSNDSWALKKFRSEMEALARIDHPNVVSILDFGQRDNGKPFLVMQYVQGGSLRKAIPRDGLPLAQVAHIMKQTGRALSAAHDAGVLHRDLKPENVMVQTASEGEDQIKLIDFGIATIGQLDSTTESSSTVGTYVYMAPEQFEGRSSVASDVYQMGVLAYELVTGIIPFRATTPGSLVLQKLEELRVLPKDLRPELPEAAQEVILQAMSVKPGERPQRARDFGDALAAALVSGNLEPLRWDHLDGRRSSSSFRRAMQARKRRRRRWMVAAAALIGIAAITFAGYLLTRRTPEAPDSVAVLPFRNETGDARLEYLTDGITESLIDNLSRIPTVRVSALGSVLRYENAVPDARKAGRELGVSRVVSGTVSRYGNAFSFYTELIDVQSGMRLWGNRYSGNMQALTSTLEQFSTEVTDQLRLKLSQPVKERLARQFEVGSEPYQDYLKGRFHLNQRTPVGFQDAIGYFNRAITADRTYAPAYSGLANTYAIMGGFGSAYGGAIPADAWRQARTAANHALGLDGTLAEAYAARAEAELKGDYDWTAAERDFQRAIQLDPNWPEGHEFYAFDLGASGRFEEAIREIDAADRLEPNSTGITLAKGLILQMANHPDESLAVVRRLAADPVGRGLAGDLVAENYWAKGMPGEALATVQSLPPTLTPHLRVPLLAAAYAHAGQSEKAREILRSYKVQSESAWWYYLVLAHLALRDTNDALTDLELAYKQRYGEMIWLGVDPNLDALRANPRFRALLRRVQQTKPKG
jgi:eukaryotic-like serine/threonine-protein kinase